MTLVDPARLSGAARKRARLAPELVVGASILVVILAGSIVTTLFPPYSVSGISNDAFAGPGGAHLLGTDNLKSFLLHP